MGSDIYILLSKFILIEIWDLLSSYSLDFSALFNELFDIFESSPSEQCPQPEKHSEQFPSVYFASSLLYVIDR